MKCFVLSSLLASLVLSSANAEIPAATEKFHCAQLTPAESFAAYHAHARMMVTLGWQPLVAPIMLAPPDERVVSTTRTTLPGG